MTKNSEAQILLTQSFVMDKIGSYWDYRDYIFSLCSNTSLKNQPVRLNIERGEEWLKEMKNAAEKFGFSNCVITHEKPISWAAYMLEQMKSNPAIWTMPFPGDHIYIEDKDETFTNYLKIGEEKNVDAISFGHIQDWDYLLDWKRIEVLENKDDYVIINWGHKFRYCKNFKFSKLAQQKIKLFLMMAPVPGFMIFKSKFLKDILLHVPHSKRWQDMEFSKAPCSWSYKVLIPKKYLYRHVHGYWAEYAFEALAGRASKFSDPKVVLDKMYIRTNYDWYKDTPSRTTYLKNCLDRTPTMRKYIEKDQNFLPEVYSPFLNTKFTMKKSVRRKVVNFFLLYFIDSAKNFLRITLRRS